MVRLDNLTAAKSAAHGANAETTAAQAAEAQRVWQQLDELARADPQKYRETIRERLEQGRRWEQLHQSAVHRGLCVKCHRQGPGASPAATAETAPRRHYINLCQSVRVECPGEAELDGWRRLDGGLTVPMVLDDPRRRLDAQGEPYCVYDVIVHPDVFGRMEADAGFLDAVVRLAMQSIEQTFQLRFKSAGYKRVGSSYKGPFQWRADGRKMQLTSANDADIGGNGKAVREPDELLDQVLRPGMGAPVHDAVQLVPTSHATTTAADSQVKVPKIVEHCSVPNVVAVSPMQLRVELPLEQDSRGFELTITERDLFLQTPLYVLYYVFEQAVDPDCARATFRTADRVLALTFVP